MTELSNAWWLFKNDQKQIETKRYPREFIARLFRLSRKWKKGGWMRRSATWHIKDLRKRFPTVVQDFSEAKKLYQEYFELPNHIKSITNFKKKILENKKEGKDSFIHVFRDEVPVKGNTQGSFYINGAYGGPGMVLQVDIQFGELKSRGLQEEWRKMYLSFGDESFTQWLWATEEEIESYIGSRSQYAYLQSIRETVLAELRMIDNQISKIN